MFRTYRSLADILGTSWIAGEGFVVASSPAGHPLQNFAFAHKLTAYSARELADCIVGGTPNIYCLHQDQMTQELLHRNGFQVAFNMNFMMAEPIGDTADNVPDTPESRQETAEFMVRQFFHRRDRGYQSQFCQSLVGATELPLITSRSGPKIVAAALLSPFVEGESVGIFNFCVDGLHQKRGVGSRLLRLLRSRYERSPLCVQCTPEMVAWYSRRDFNQTTTILAFRRGD